MTPELRTFAFRALRWCAAVAGTAVLATGLLLWTPPGHGLLAWGIGKATGGNVIIKGLDGVLPDHARAQTIEFRDEDGAWLRIFDAELDWSFLPALRHHIVVHQVTAARVELLRRPLPAPASESSGPQIDIDNLVLPHIDIAPSLIGYKAMLAARGRLHFVSRHQLDGNLTVTRPGASDLYTVQGGIAADVATGTASIRESPDGLLGKIIGLPGLGAISLSAQASGNSAANRMAFRLQAGALQARGQGTISLTAQRADVDFLARAAAMRLNDDLAWNALRVEGHLHGGLAVPEIQATFHLDQVQTAGMTIATLEGDAAGHAGTVDVNASATTLRLPGSHGEIFAGAPVIAKAHIDPTNPQRPVSFSLVHPLAALEGQARTAGALTAQAHVTVPSLKPFAALVNQDFRGSAQLTVNLGRSGRQLNLALEGGVKAQGPSLVARMLGPDASLTFQATLLGADMPVSHMRVRGAGFDSEITGGLRAGRMDYRITTALPDLSRLTPSLQGRAKLSGTVAGVPAKALINLSGAADLASRGFKQQRIAITLRAVGLPSPTSARLTADGRLDDAGLKLAADWSVTAKGHDATVTFDWKSLAVHGTLAVPLKGLAGGHAVLDAKNLTDIGALAGVKISGTLHATGDLKSQNGRNVAALHLAGGNLAAADAALKSLDAEGSIGDPFGTPRFQMSLKAAGLAAIGLSGAAAAELSGPAGKLAVTLTADLKDSSGTPARLNAKALADMSAAKVRVDNLEAVWRGERALLAAPVTFDLAGGMAVDHLSLKLAGGTVTAAGRLTPKLALTAMAQNIQAASFQAFAPQLAADGILSGRADLHGTIAAPLGTLAVQGRALRMRGYSSKLAPADLSGTATLQGATALLDAKLIAGASGGLTVQGTVPLQNGKAFDLRAAGTVDLAMLNPLLAANGRQLAGQLSLDGKVGGPQTAPRFSGAAAVKDGELQDYTRGIRVQSLNANIRAQDNVLQITSFTAVAGPGTISGSGTIDPLAPGWPIALAISARNARPVASDLMTASFTGDLKLTGKLDGTTTLAGQLTVPRAALNLPNSFPPEVRSLNIRRRGEPAPVAAPAASTTMLDLSIATTGPVTVRGHGIDADLGGNLRLTGSTNTPLVAGGLEMRRGTLTVAGQTLSFTTGKVSFDGTGVRNRLDPTLNFVAQETSGGVTAVLTVSGYASSPRIALTSSPQLPQDEVLAHLLFQQSAKQLSPLQLAEIAQALAALGGIGTGFNPIASLRGGLGLDRLAVGGSNSVTSGTTVEAGKYVSHNIYVGGKQGLAGGTQAQVQVDITRNLKAEATISTGTAATATQGSTAQDNGSNIGLSYQFEY